MAPLVRTDGPQLGHVVDSRAVSALPLASRNVTQMLALSPGAVTHLPDNTGVGRNTQTISVNGARVTQNNFEIDGVDVNTMGTSGAVTLPVPAPESLQEFKVQTSLYDATFGRAGGANIQIVTRTGTNAFHGVVYGYFRHDALNANNPFLKAAGIGRPILRRNAFGGTLGGPVRKDKTLFFVSYQGTREANGASILNSISSAVLIAPGLTNDRSAAALAALSSAVGAGGAVHPTAAALLQARLPNGQFVIPTPAGKRPVFGLGALTLSRRPAQYQSRSPIRWTRIVHTRLRREHAFNPCVAQLARRRAERPRFRVRAGEQQPADRGAGRVRQPHPRQRSPHRVCSQPQLHRPARASTGFRRRDHGALPQRRFRACR